MSFRKICVVITLKLAVATTVFAQFETDPAPNAQTFQGNPPAGVQPAQLPPAAPSDAAPVDDIGPIQAGPPRVTRVREGSGQLPTDAGQVWREYDIRPYVDRMQGIPNPQQNIVEWVVRYTGTETWFGQPFGILNADSETLRVYHSPDRQAVVTDVVERFVRSDQQHVGVGVHLVTVGSPSWRSHALKMMRPVPVQTPGLDAWLLTREDAARLGAELRSRVDFREHSSSGATVLNGQSHTLSRWTPRSFSRSIVATPTAAPGYQIQRGEIKEGFSLTISPLASLDGTNMEAIVKCHVDQVEKMSSISVEIPPPAKGHVSVDVPQVSSWRIHERFQWPQNEVLLISRGVVAMPGLDRPDISNLPAIITSSGRPPRAEALLFLVCRSGSSGGAVPQQAAQQGQQGQRAARLNYHGRY